MRYKVFNCSVDTTTMQSTLNKLAKEGWQYKSTNLTTGGGGAYIVMEKPELKPIPTIKGRPRIMPPKRGKKYAAKKPWCQSFYKSGLIDGPRMGGQ